MEELQDRDEEIKLVSSFIMQTPTNRREAIEPYFVHFMDYSLGQPNITWQNFDPNVVNSL